MFGGKTQLTAYDFVTANLIFIVLVIVMYSVFILVGNRLIDWIHPEKSTQFMLFPLVMFTCLLIPLNILLSRTCNSCGSTEN